MSSDSKPYVPFSQRTGLAPIPPQLKLGDVSTDLRRLIDYYIKLEITRERHSAYNRSWRKEWKRVAQDLHVLHFEQSADTFSAAPGETLELLAGIVSEADIGPLFDTIEFLVRHPNCSGELKSELTEAFVATQSAYRIFDNEHIAAIGTEEQAEAFERAVAEAETKNATAARKHLLEAAIALRNFDWPGSVRESIHAVEAMAVRLAPETKTLGAALTALEGRGHLHGGLKTAFGALYGYTSDEKGVRHALFDDTAKVDEADALFMLGACASFVTYLLARDGTS